MKQESCFYKGEVRHRRFIGVKNEFTYPVFMSYIDIDKSAQLFNQTGIFSSKKWSLIRFNEADYFEKTKSINTLRDYINHLVVTSGLPVPSQVMLLTNTRFMGYIINPISCFYCFDEDDQLIAIVAKVTNTPWGEIKNYVLHCNPVEKNQRIIFNKDMHVSPFNPMAMVYDWRNNLPHQQLSLHMNCMKDEVIHMDATVNLKMKSWTIKNKILLALEFPLMTLSIASKIYWQALRLLVKKAIFYPHPKKQTLTSNTVD